VESQISVSTGYNENSKSSDEGSIPSIGANGLIAMIVHAAD
jgi:hypothetical protein